MQERSRDSIQEREVTFEDRHESDMIEKYESKDGFEDEMPILEARYDSDSDSDSESDSVGDDSTIEIHLLQKNIFKKAKSPSRITIARANAKFSLEDLVGKKETYLELLDTGSTGSLLSEDLVQLFKSETKKSNSTWNTNNGEFETGKTAVTKNLRFLEFTNKLKVDRSKCYVNKNVEQKYKIIFGLEFLIENKFDFLLSTRMID